MRVSCYRLGRSSLGLRYRYEVGSRHCLEARMLTACIDLDRVTSIPIPEAFRHRFEAIRETAAP